MIDYSALPWKVESGAISLPNTYLIHCKYGPIAIVQESPHISVGDFKQNMETLQKALDCYTRLGPILDYEFDTVHEAGKRLRQIQARDFPESAPDEWPIDEGSEDYVIRAVIEALFGED